jgi:hypothetical protein
MDNALLVAGEHSPSRTIRFRVPALAVGVVVVVFAALFLMQQQAEAQINVSQLVCGILISLRTAFSGFLSFLNALFTGLLQAFGCAISG